MTRLLLACALGYLIILALGASPKAKELRPLLEIPRRQGRHGTTRTLSVLFIGLLRLSLDAFRAGAWGEIEEILLALLKGKESLFITPHRPQSYPHPDVIRKREARPLLLHGQCLLGIPYYWISPLKVPFGN